MSRFAVPAWADTPHARELLADALANPPATYIRSAYACSPAHERFNCSTSKPFAELRRMHKAWRDAELALLDRQYEATHIWDEDASKAIFGAETPDDLLRRLLSEQRVTRINERELRRTIELQKRRAA